MDWITAQRDRFGSSDSLQLSRIYEAGDCPTYSSSCQSLANEEKLFSLLHTKRRPTQPSLLSQVNPDLYKKHESSPKKQISLEDVANSTGQVFLKLAYNADKSDFIVTVVEARNLLPAGGKVSMSNFLCEPYIRVSVDPEVDRYPKERVFKMRKKTKNPKFDHTFKFPMTYDQMEGRSLKIDIMDDSPSLGRNRLLGELSLQLDGSDICSGVESWFDLHRSIEGTTVGEIQCQLTYLPSAERLTIGIQQARNLRKMDITGSSDPYVKLHLCANGKPIKKKKTTVIRQSTEPKWMEQIHFNVSERLLAVASLELIVVDKDIIGHSDVIGWVNIGPSSRNKNIPEEEKASCPAAAHFWKELLQTKSAAPMWLPLEWPSTQHKRQASLERQL